MRSSEGIESSGEDIDSRVTQTVNTTKQVDEFGCTAL